MIHFIWNRFTRFVDIISQTHTYNTHVSRLITVSAMAAATVLSLIYHRINPAGTANIALIYILTVILISYHTDKYRYGILAAICSVFFINLFTYPFFVFNFAVSGYPLTFLFMYFISILTSATTFRLKEQARRIKDDEDLIMEAEKEKLRANLLRAVSHDLRTPLTSISGNAGILMEKHIALDEAKKQELYTAIYDDSMWLVDLTENLLSITRIENGTMQLNLNAELIEEVFQEALAHVDRKAAEHRVTTELSDPLLMARMDVRLVVQVLVNLVNNAVKYTPPGSHIRLSARKEGALVRIRVADDGPGVSDEAKPHLFDLFYTAGGGAPDSRRGLGLGLNLCKSIVEAHGGQIGIQDNQPRGAVFDFTLPLEEVKLDDVQS